MLEITRKDFGDVTVLELDGRLTLGETTALFKESVQDLLRSGRRRLVVDYSNIAFVDSAGNDAIVKAYVASRNSGGDIVIVGLKGRVKDVFQITKLSSVFVILPDVGDALKHFGVASENG